MKRLTILGAAGAGKSTQAKKLAEIFQVPAISTGEILRDAISTCDELGKQAYHYVQSGELVPDPVMIKLMRWRLRQPDVQSGWVLEGYPRTAFQAEELDFLLNEFSVSIDKAVYLNVSEDLLKERSLQRGSSDDTPELIARRLELFSDRIKLLVDYYEHKQKLLVVDGSLDLNEVTKKIQEGIA